MFKKGHYILAFLSFLISLCIYTMTMAPTTSFWDCGEFIASSFIMGVPHPPGAPLFLIIGNVFSNIPIFNDIGARVNFLSPLISAFSVLFLYLIIVNLIEKFIGDYKDLSKFIIINLSAFIASLTFAVTDSHWFNAVESEVYSMSTFFTAIVLWLILKWADNSNTSWNSRYLLIIAYMIGLATGVHLLNLLALPFIALIIYFKKYEFSIKSFLITTILTSLCFILIYIGFILGLPDIVSKFNSILILFVIVFLLFSSIILLHISKISNLISNIGKFSSVLTLSIVLFLIFNKLFISSSNEDLMQSYLNQESDIRTQEQYFQQVINSYITEQGLTNQNFKDIITHRLNNDDKFTEDDYTISAFLDNNYGQLSEFECKSQGNSIWYDGYCGNGILDWQEQLNIDKKNIHKEKDQIPQLYSLKINNNFIELDITSLKNVLYNSSEVDKNRNNFINQLDNALINNNGFSSCNTNIAKSVFPSKITLIEGINNNEILGILKTYFKNNSLRLSSSSISSLIEKFNQQSNNNNGIEIVSKVKSVSFLKLLLIQSTTALFFLFITLILLFYFSYYYLWYKNSNTYTLKLFFSCVLLVLIGYSTYGAIFIRAKQNPRINENTPDNLERALAYINRDQYGAVESFNPTVAIQNSNSGHWKRWTRDKQNIQLSEKLNFIWNYQVKEMYLRYFAWQFIGRSDKNDDPWLIKDLDNQLVGNRMLDGIDYFRYGLPLAFIFGVLGIIFHFSRDWKRALAVLSVFLSTGILIILYLNQYDPQPRERDYSYVGSFFAFSIWIGFGIAFIQEKIKVFFEESNISSFISIAISIFIFLLMPITMLKSDYTEHNRTGNYVAWDYGYNLLNSCEPNAIIFTNGDNDTFPLWYLQEVEKIRTDVRVVNLSLLNTPWYIKQLINDEPKLNINFCNNMLIDDIYNIEKEYLISTYEGYNLCSHSKMNFDDGFIDCELNIKNNVDGINDNLRFNVPLYRKQFLRVQDYMILQILVDELSNRPIYFAATVSENNQAGLKPYLSMEGMTYKIKTEKVNGINFSKMKQNLILDNKNDTIRTGQDYLDAINNNQGIYRFTNLNNDQVYFNSNIKRLVQNYRIGYIRMAQNKLSENSIDEAANIITIMNDNFPKETLPLDPWIGFELLEKIYGPLGYIDKQRDMLNYLSSKNPDVNIQLISILKSLEFGHYDLVDKYITQYVINNDLSFENKMALFYESISRKYHPSLDILINNIAQDYISENIEKIDTNSLYAFLGSLIKVDNSSENKFLSDIIVQVTQKLLVDNYKTNLTIDSQKDLGDILAKYMQGESFIDFCNNLFPIHKVEGLMYSLVNLYLLNDYNQEALDEIEKWLSSNPNNKRMINKRNKILEKLNIQ